jgi:Na+/proline symporter
MRGKLVRILIGFAIAIAAALALGELFKLYAASQLSEQKQQEVLIKAIPFVAVFAAIVLAFICLIVIVAVLLNGKVPQRTYNPIERIIVAGIFIGVVGLFQVWKLIGLFKGWKLFPYQYGFLVLLVSLLLFMIWSHLSPMPASLSRERPPLTRRAHVIGLIAGCAVWIIMAALLINHSSPAAPYGNNPKVWSTMSPADQQEVIDAADHEYQTVKIPLLILITLLPGGIVYLAGRELADSGQPASQGESVPRPAQGAGVPVE